MNMTKTEDDKNEDNPKWRRLENRRWLKMKTTQNEHDQNRRRQKTKTTKNEDDQKLRQPKTKTTKKFAPERCEFMCCLTSTKFLNLNVVFTTKASQLGG